MLYSVKNVVEGFEEIDYNDGVRTLFLYTDGEYGGSPELKRLLTYIKHSTAENAADEELKTLHAMIETCKDMGLSKRDTQQYVETKFSMSQNTAGNFMTKYWK